MDVENANGVSAFNRTLPPAQVLVSKGVRPEKVLFLCLMASPEGVRTLFRTFPDIKVITSEIDSHVDSDTMALIPGVGEFGDRYVGAARSVWSVWVPRRARTVGAHLVGGSGWMVRVEVGGRGDRSKPA